MFERYRLVVCVGTGGVGKTTVSAALALAAAERGRRAMVLTIDPARALARALGLAELSSASQRVAISAPGVLAAGMLDQKRAWDAFVTRHAPTPEVARTVLGNSFYQRLSTSFAGSTEYVAIEELCRLAESGEHDLIVLDTPPAAHALDFLRAPERIDRLLERDVIGTLALGRGAWRTANATARFVLRRLERAAGTRTLHEISTFFVALDLLAGAVLERTRRARELLRDPQTAFVLVAGPRQLVVDESVALAQRLRAHAAPLAAIVVNRVHPVPAVAPEAAAAVFTALDGAPAAAWLRARWDDAVAEAGADATHLARLRAALPEVPLLAVPEAGHDLHSLADLARVSAHLSDRGRA
jgi:anion-transporting  ArsA/GET3 family ATPase